MSSFRFRVAACYSSTFKDPVDRGPNKFSNGRIFYHCNPSTQQCQFCFTSVYASAYRFLPVSVVNFFFVKASRLLPRKLCNALLRCLLEFAYKWNRTGKKKNLHTAVQKVAKFRASCVNERRISASFCPFKKCVRTC